MARLLSNDASQVTYYERYGDGTISTNTATHQRSYVWKSDVVKRSRDERGFRKPTNYSMWACYASAGYAQYAYRYGGAPLQICWVAGPASTQKSINFQNAGTIGSGFTRIPDIPSSVKARARTELLNKIVKSDFNAAVFAGEAGRSIKMISEAVETLREAYIGVRRGDFVRVARNVFKSRNWSWVAERARKRASSSGDAWLAYTYGWKPLVYDIWNAVQLIQQGWKPSRGPLMSVKRRISWKETLTPSGSLERASWKGHCTKGFEVCCYYTVSNSWLAGLNNIGLINPFTVIWELMPMSFVIDWLLPIGNFLDALTAHVGLEFYGGYETSYIDKKGRLEYYEYPSALAFNIGGKPFTLDIKATGMSRTALTSFPSPSPFYLEKGLNATRAISSIALLNQRWR